MRTLRGHKHPVHNRDHGMEIKAGVSGVARVESMIDVGEKASNAQ